MRKLIWLSVFIVAFLTSSVAAEEYEIVQGKDVEVCKVCLENLHQQSNKDAVCSRQYKTELGLQPVTWNTLKPLDDLSFLKRIMQYVEKRTPPLKLPFSGYDDEKAFRREIRRESVTGWLVLSITDVDIDNDGSPEPVVKYRHSECTEDYGPPKLTQTLVVLTADRAHIDPAKTSHVMQNPDAGPVYPHGYVANQGYEVFRYRGETYFDRWDSHVVSDPETLFVYKTANKITTMLCKFRQVMPSKGESK